MEAGHYGTVLNADSAACALARIDGCPCSQSPSQRLPALTQQAFGCHLQLHHRCHMKLLK